MLKKSSKNNTRKILQLVIVIIFILLVAFCTWIFIRIDSANCFIGNYDEYICYDGEIYLKLCDENKYLFSEDYYNEYQYKSVTDYKNMDECVQTVYGFNPNIKFYCEKVRIVYTNKSKSDIQFMCLDHFLDSPIYVKSNL